VRVFNPDATERFSLTPFGVTFTAMRRLELAQDGLFRNAAVLTDSPDE
jgi:hypothetical protein